MSAQPATTGHCLCGAIRFAADGEPLAANLCHCESCRRHSGGAVAAFVTFAKDAVRWSGTERTSYRSSPPVIRSFCGNCGSSLAYEHDHSANEIDLYLGAFDDPGRFPPQKHVHYGERVAWFETTDRAPRYRSSSASGEPPVAVEPGVPAEPQIAIGPVPPVIPSGIVTPEAG
jgi:hypothetical protein